MKKFRVLGETVVTVSCVITVRDDTELKEKYFYQRAKTKFGGIHAYLGNGGDMKLIGVEEDGETIAADEPVVWTDFYEEVDEQ